MSQQEYRQNSAAGGISQASKIGLRNAVAYLRGADIRTDPSEIRALPGASYDSTTITILGTTESVHSPDANPETTSVDGPVSREVGSTSGLLLYDNFNDNSINSDKWATSGTVAEENGRLRVGKKNSSGSSGSADTNNKTTGNPAGEPIDTSAQWWQNWNAGGNEGPDVYTRITNGTDYIEFRSQHAVNTTLVSTAGSYGSTTLGSVSSKSFTVKVAEVGSDIIIYINGVSTYTISSKTFAANSYFEVVAEADAGNTTNFYMEVDSVYINGTVAASEAFATLRAGSGTTSGDSDASGKAVKLISGASSNYDEMGRSILLFDTSGIPDSATVNSATLELYVTAIKDEIGTQQISVVNTTPASDDELVIADFGQVGTTLQATTVNLSALTAGQYNSITLNATGEGNINLTGVTKFGLALEADRANSDPSAGTSEETNVIIQFADGDNPPVLRVNYTVTSPDETSTRDLVKWIVSGTPHDTNVYSYDRSGNIYSRTSAGVWKLERSVTLSDGQGLTVFSDYLYYTQRTQLGRYGPLSGAAVFDDDFLTGLNSTPDFSPMIQFLDYFVVCHGNEVKKVYGTETPTADIGTADLTLPTGYKIRAVAQVGEFLAFGAWRGTSINDVETGKIYFWDGTATRYNFIVEVAEGAVNALASLGGTLFYMAGNKGSMMAWERGPLGRVWQVPKQKISDYMEVYPGAMTVWQALLHTGIAANTNSTTIRHGVYAYGTRDPRLFPPALSHDYWQSTDDISGDADIKIGAVLGKGQDLFFSWGDSDGNYGVDKVNIGDAPSLAGGTIELLRFDDDDTSRGKIAGDFIVTHEGLASENLDTITLKNDKERTGSYTSKTANSTDDAVKTEYGLTGEFREIDLAVDFTGNPVITGMKFEFDDQLESRKP